MNKAVISGGKIRKVIIRDRSGKVLDLEECDEGRLGEIVDFYNEFSPKGEFQGIPPTRKAARRRWVRDIVSGWRNFVLLDGDKVVGHIAVSRAVGSIEELIIFLHQDYRGKGIGTAALKSIRQWLSSSGTNRLWLTVQNTNTPAIRCFKKVGFEFSSPMDDSEREMLLTLTDQGSDEQLHLLT